MPLPTPADVLDFWFGEPPTDEPTLLAKVSRWFHGGPDLDREIVARFGAAVEAAVEGRLDAWAAQPPGRLASVLLLDQLTRNVFRGSPRMYAGDGRAQALALQAFDDGSAGTLAWVERLFLSLPLLHAEDAALLRRSAAIARALALDVPPPYAPMSAMYLEQAAKYGDVMARFGRFPHRNTLLGRVSTPEEREFLTHWDAIKAPAGSGPAA